MRVILDTNQADRVARTPIGTLPDGGPTIALAPLVWAELMLGEYSEERLRAIARFDVRFGLDLDVVYERLCRLDENQIPQFRPFVAIGTPEHARLHDALKRRPRELVKQAEKIRDDTRQMLSKWEQRLADHRKKGRDAKSRGTFAPARKSVTIQEAMDAYAEPQAEALVSRVTARRTRALKASSDESFYRAALENVYLARFLRLVLCITLGYGGAWQDDSLNIPVSQNRNDSTDMILGLYIGDGDILATADGKLRRAAQHIDREGRFSVSTWDECEGCSR